MHAIRALREVPGLGTTSIISGLCSLLDFIYGTEPSPENEYHTAHPLPPYDAEEQIIRLTFECFMRPQRLYFGPYSNVGIVHYITHADALLELSRLGYQDIARKGYDAHRCHINTSGRFTPDERHKPCVPAEYGPMTSEYWEQEVTGEDIGHQFKMAESFTRLWNRLEDGDLKVAAHDRMLHIMGIYLKSTGARSRASAHGEQTEAQRQARKDALQE